MHQSSGKMHPRVGTLHNTNDNILRGLRRRQSGSPMHWEEGSQDGTASGIFLNPDGQVIDAGAPAAGAAADTPVQGVGVTATSQLSSPSEQVRRPNCWLFQLLIGDLVHRLRLLWLRT